MIDKSKYPESTHKLNWGAFLLTPLWAIYHKKYSIGILSLIPILGLLGSLSALVYGRQWAWDNREWSSEYYFEESISKWNTAGFIISGVLFILLILF